MQLWLPSLCCSGQCPWAMGPLSTKVTLHYKQYVAVKCSAIALDWSALQCRQCISVHYRALQCRALYFITEHSSAVHCWLIDCIAVHTVEIIAVQCRAVQCKVIQCSLLCAVHCVANCFWLLPFLAGGMFMWIAQPALVLDSHQGIQARQTVG